ncbi:ParB N-terminal domain-containing protein [Bradyrhizobium canariense]|uniref:ParB N-terminal domain-containing protein n=1 Tax=Bradyrhizobium canariense TaxID=255045 RepID=UPI0013025770|nr:ParB N-terminal domain-containing protein [Bradyrhizobium canariense]
MAKQARRLTRRDVVTPPDTGESVADLEQKLGKAQAPRVSKGKLKLPRENIRVAEQVFQWRLPGRDAFERADHILEMAKSIRNTGAPLTDILVYPCGGAFYVVDGHHRLAAYDTARWSMAIPARVFEGTFRDAQVRALTANSKNKLPLSREEKSEAAWRLVRQMGYSLTVPEIASASTVHQRTVHTMRTVWKEVQEIAQREERRLPHDLTWRAARALHKGEEPSFDRDEWVDVQAQKLVELLRKANLGVNLTKDAEITARALRLISDGLPRALIEEWSVEEAEAISEIAERHANPPGVLSLPANTGTCNLQGRLPSGGGRVSQWFRPIYCD